jgi:DDE superfamily endonuclease
MFQDEARFGRMVRIRRCWAQKPMRPTVCNGYEREFIVMVVDGASSHVAKYLVVPKNIKLLRPPPYAPELNPQEHVWDELREKEFPNRVYADMASVRAQLETGLPRLAGNRKALRSLTAWPWIDSLNLNAH